MSAYLLVMLNVQSTDWVADYVANVPTIIRKFGGEYLFVSKTIVHEEGDGKTPDQIAVFTFPSTDAAHDFIHCAEYAPYAAARMTGSTADLFAIGT